jgi:hypothetical protein
MARPGHQPPLQPEEPNVGLFSSKKTKQTTPAETPPLRRDVVRAALKANRDRYYRTLNKCTPAEVAYVEDALKRHGYPP